MIREEAIILCIKESLHISSRTNVAIKAENIECLKS